MKKTYKLQNLDCANCAAKMERTIQKIDGVQNVNINFMTTKLILEADDNYFDSITKEVEKVCKKIDRNIIIQKI